MLFELNLKWSAGQVGKKCICCLMVSGAEIGTCLFSSNSANSFISNNENKLEINFSDFWRLRLNNKNHPSSSLNATLATNTHPQRSTHSGSSTFGFVIHSPFKRWRPPPHWYFTVRFDTQRFVQLHSRMREECEKRRIVLVVFDERRIETE